MHFDIDGGETMMEVGLGDEVESAPDVSAAIDQLARRRRRRQTRVWLSRIVILIFVLVGWQLSSGRLAPAFVISSPSKVASQLLRWATDGYLFSNLAVTVEETAIGFGAGVLVGGIAGILIGMSRYASDISSPYVNAMYAVPKIMLGPLFVVWFGIDLRMKAVLSGSFVVFIVFYNIWAGVQEVDRDLLEVLEIMGAGRMAIARRLYVPSAVSWLFNSLRLAFPVALIGAVVGELVASSSGLGYVAENAATTDDVAGVFAAVVAVTVVAVVIDQAIIRVQRSVNRRYGHREGGRLVI